MKTRTQGIRRLRGWLAALVLAFGSLMPAGVMPVAAGSGLVLVLCTPQGAQSVVIDPATGKAVPVPDSGTPASACVWAGAAVAALAPPALPLPRPAPAARRDAPPPALTVVPAAAAPPPWPRGPPTPV